jgi:hypothetical protein
VLRALVVGFMAIALTVASALAQEMHPTPRAGTSALLLGLPLFTSDGQEIGKVIGWAKHQGEHLLVAEIDSGLV